MAYRTLLLLLLFTIPVFAQSVVALRPDAWDFDGTEVEFVDYRGESALHLIAGDEETNESNIATVKDLKFSSGTIEYDVAFTKNTFFTAVYFRYQDEENTEHVYLRTNGIGNPQANTSIQYATVIKGVNLWDLSGEYQSNAELFKDGYNHVKLVIHDQQLLAYVNDMETPALYIPHLDGEFQVGKIGFDGDVYLANIRVDGDAVGDLPPGSGFDPVHNDSRYLRRWQVTPPISMPEGREPSAAQLPTEETKWTPIVAERLGLINLSRRYGATPRGERRLTWLVTTITTETEQLRRLDFGFSDEVYIYLNGYALHLDKNLFGTPGMKTPRGRLSVENSTIDLPLRTGDNEILIGVTNFFYGWGIVARLDDARGLKF